MLHLRPAFSSLVQDTRTALLTLWRNHSVQLVIFLALVPWLVSAYFRQNLSTQGLTEIGAIVLVYWFFTRSRDLGPDTLRRPWLESAIAVGFAALWVLMRVVQYAGWLAIPYPEIAVCNDFVDTIIPKMIEMAFVPVIVFLLLGYSLTRQGFGLPTWQWIAAGLPIFALLYWGLGHQTAAGLATRTTCFYLGAGLPEEVLFRALLIPRLATLTRRVEWGILLSGFVFGATHIPINLHGSGLANWPVALESAFTFQMGIGLALGYAWVRTRNAWPLSIIHALVDAAPMV